MTASRQPAPGELEFVRQLVNTLEVESGQDAIGTPEALRAWLAAQGLPGADAPLDAADVRQAASVREALRCLLLANNGQTLDRSATDTLNDAAARCTMVVRFDPQGRSDMRPTAAGVNAALGRILAIVDDAMVEGTWARLKACRSEDCQWAFYDASKNRSSAWCSMAVCGNRAKARGYRQRQKDPARPP